MLKNYANEYLQECTSQKGLSDNSIQAYRCDLNDYNRYVKMCGEDLILAGEGYVLYLQKERKLMPRSLRRRVVAVRSFLKWLMEKQPKLQIFVPQPPNRRSITRELPKTVKPHLLDVILGVNSSKILPDHVHLGLKLLVATGLRVSELCSLKACDFDPDTAALRVRGKGAKERVVYVANKNLVENLKVRITEITKAGQPNGWLLLNARGRRLQPQSIRWHLKQSMERMGIDSRLTPHMFRHTSATMHLERGVDIRFVQRMLGHSNIATTQIYTHVSDSALKSAMMQGDPLAEIHRLRYAN